MGTLQDARQTHLVAGISSGKGVIARVSLRSSPILGSKSFLLEISGLLLDFHSSRYSDSLDRDKITDEGVIKI